MEQAEIARALDVFDAFLVHVRGAAGPIAPAPVKRAASADAGASDGGGNGDRNISSRRSSLRRRRVVRGPQAEDRLRALRIV